MPIKPVLMLIAGAFLLGFVAVPISHLMAEEPAPIVIPGLEPDQPH